MVAVMRRNVDNFHLVEQNQIIRSRRSQQDIQFDVQLRLAEEGLATGRYFTYFINNSNVLIINVKKYYLQDYCTRIFRSHKKK